MVAKLSAGFGLLVALLFSGCTTAQPDYQTTAPAPTVQSAIPATPVVNPPVQSQTASANDTIEESPVIAPSWPAPSQPNLSSQPAQPDYLASTPPDAATQPQAPVPNTGYAGNCACPNDLDARGRRCGARSAYSRAGGSSPTCNGKAALAYQTQSPSVETPSYVPSPPASGYGAISSTTGLPRTHYVRGYYRKNGTYVRPYYRSRRR
jgi:hypothetical protein